MKLSVQFPMHTKSSSPNSRFAHPMAKANAVKRERGQVRLILDSQLPRLRQHVAPPDVDPRDLDAVRAAREEGRLARNFFRVTIVRIGAGLLDDDNVHGAVKAVRDEIAAWLGIKDDHAAPASWKVAQQKCPAGFHAVRIEIEDDDRDTREVHKILGPAIPKLGPVIGDVRHERRTVMGMLNEAYRREVAGERAPAPTVASVARGLGMTAAQLRAMAPLKCAEIDRMKQARLVFRRSYYAPPGQDEDADEVTLDELTGPLFEVDQPPPRIIKGGRVLLRRQDFHPALGEHWIYEAAPSAARPTRRGDEDAGRSELDGERSARGDAHRA